MDAPFAIAPGDVLAQPTRARLFALLGELRRPAGTVELAERLNLHPNGVRMHLERMERAGLVARATARQARGRPRDTWTLAADARPAGRPPSAYADLGRWLARAIGPGKNRLRGVESVGRRIGRELAPEDTSAPAEQRMHDALVALGFQPKREAAASGTLSYRLCNCPYRQAARESPQVICTLHRGMTRGLLDAIDPHATLTGFVAEDPYEAGCLIELDGPLAELAIAPGPSI
jgi:predicted ArsR family transcriptional regulator